MTNPRGRPALKTRHDAETINRYADRLTQPHFDILQAGVLYVSAQDIGQALAIPEGTAKSRLHRAQVAIDRLIEGEQVESEIAVLRGETASV